MRVLPFVLSFAFLVSGCNKLPESETAKQVGAQPKQIIDKVSGDTAKALQQGAERQHNAEKRE